MAHAVKEEFRDTTTVMHSIGFKCAHVRQVLSTPAILTENTVFHYSHKHLAALLT